MKAKDAGVVPAVENNRNHSQNFDAGEAKQQHIDVRGNLRRFYKQESSILSLLNNQLHRVKVTTHDISSRGIGFSSCIRLPTRSLFIFCVALKDEKLLFFGQIHRARPAEAGSYIYGAKILDNRKITPGDESIPMEWLGITLNEQGFSEVSDESRVRGKSLK